MSAPPIAKRHKVATSSLIVMGGFVLSKVIGIVRQSIIARTFGAGPELDAYYAAFKLPDLLLTLIAGGAVATTFIPVFAGHLSSGDRERSWRLASAVLNVVLALMTVVAVAAAIAAPWLVRTLVAPGFDPALQDQTAGLLRIVLVSSVVFSVSSLVMSVLQAHERFLLPALADFFYDVGIIGGAVLLAPRMGIRGLALGVVAGALLHLLIQVPGLIRCRARYIPTLRTGDRSLVQLLRLMGPRILILGMFQWVFLFTTSLASGLEEGSITAFSMGWTLMQMPEVIFGMAIATAVFPAMAQLAASGRGEQLREVVSNALRAILFLTFPSAVALLLLGRPYIALLFRSAAFGARAAEMVYQATAAFTLGLFGHSVLELAARIYYAHKNTLVPFWIALGATALNATLCVAFAPWLGQAGLALANSIAVTLQSGVLLWLGWKTRVRFGWAPVWATTWRSAAAAAVMAAVILILDRAMPESGLLWRAAIGTAVGGGVYLGAMALLYYREMRAVARTLVKGRVQSS